MTLRSGTDTKASVDRGVRDGPLYLDCAATTPIDPDVLAEVVRYLDTDFGNAGSRTHSFGQRAKDRVNRAREQVALGADASAGEVLFTSGATESNNIAILGLEEFGRLTGRMHLVASSIEHKAVLEPMRRLAARGFTLTEVPPTAGGWVTPESIASAVRKDTLLVSVMAANNETGILQPITSIAQKLSGSDAYFHVDGAQAFGKVDGIFDDKRIDLISISGHKLYAPKGIGALIARRRGYEKPPLQPLVIGGGQERGLRAGTLPVALIAGLGLGVEKAEANKRDRWHQALVQKKRLLRALSPLQARINGDQDRCLSNMLNFSVPGVDSEAAIVALKDVAAISNGSACTSHSYTSSHVLSAMGLPRESADEALRFSWCFMTGEPQWDSIVEKLSSVLR